jgi:hypothetical protein
VAGGSATSLTALLLIGGVGNALGGPSVSALLKRAVAVHRQGLAFGAQQAGAPLGALLVGVALPVVAIRWAGDGPSSRELCYRCSRWPLRRGAGATAAPLAGEPGLIAAAALLAGGLGRAWPGGLTLAVVQRSPQAPGWAVGGLMTGLFVGGVSGPLLTGFLAEHDLFVAAWVACACVALLAAATIVETLRREAGAGGRRWRRT